MKCLLCWIGSIAIESDVLLFHTSAQKDSFCKFPQEDKGYIMGEGEECIELKFRIYDGTDMAHGTYASSTTVATLKQKLVAEWPQGKTITPKSMHDVKLIHAGKILDDNKTLADSRITIGDLPGGVITMHVVVQPPVAKKKKDKEHMGKMNSCSCTIL